MTAKAINEIGNKITEMDRKISGFSPSISDHVLGRVYYIICTGADAVQTCSKIVFLVLTQTIAIIFFGQSKICNQWNIHAYQDVKFSFILLFQSFRGIIDPRGALNTKIRLQKNNPVEPPPLKNSITIIDNIGEKILLAGKGITIIPSIVMAATRFFSVALMHLISFGTSDMLRVLGNGSLFSLFFSIACSGNCFKAIFVPENYD